MIDWEARYQKMKSEGQVGVMKWVRENDLNITALWQNIKNSIRPVIQTGMRVLDFGCGPGYNVKELKFVFDFLAYSGIDISETAVAEARKRYPENEFYTYKGDLDDIEFDYMFASYVFQHLEDFHIKLIMNDMYYSCPLCKTIFLLDTDSYRNDEKSRELFQDTKWTKINRIGSFDNAGTTSLLWSIER